MIYHHLFDQLKEKRRVRAGLIGSGHYGTAVIHSSVLHTACWNFQLLQTLIRKPPRVHIITLGNY